MRSALAIALIAVLLLSSLVYATLQTDLETHDNCNFCGMTRSKYPYSRMLVNFDNGSAVGTCSLHCTACALTLSNGLSSTSILTADFNSKELIAAKKATWVMGGNKPGVMTARAKWAFADRTAAETFIGTNGGEIVSFDRALEAAAEDLFSDSLKMQKQRKMKNML